MVFMDGGTFILRYGTDFQGVERCLRAYGIWHLQAFISDSKHRERERTRRYLLCQQEHKQQQEEEKQGSWPSSKGVHDPQNFYFQTVRLQQLCLDIQILLTMELLEYLKTVSNIPPNANSYHFRLLLKQRIHQYLQNCQCK